MIQEKPNTAIVVLTLHEDEYDVRKLFKAGARGFVLKKSAGTELTKAVLAVHGGGKYADPAMAQVLAMNSANEAKKRAQAASGPPMSSWPANASFSDISRLLTSTRRSPECWAFPTERLRLIA